MLSDRHNIVVIADEAHRTQYGFEAKLKERKVPVAQVLYAQEATSVIATGDGVPTAHHVAFEPPPLVTERYQVGYAQHLRDALPQATFVAFTGTPVSSTDRDTRAVFGDYIHVYDMQQAKEDGATVAIYYESRLAKLRLKEGELLQIDDEVDALTEDEEDSQQAALKSRWAALEKVVGAAPRVASVAADLVAHFEARNAAQPGKAMVVAMSRDICVHLYNEIVRLRPTWHDTSAQKRSDDARDLAIRQIINQAVVSDAVVDIFDAVGLDKPNIGLLDDAFLAQVRNLPERNLAVELLQRLLEGEVKSRFASNVVQERKFSEMLASVITRYQNRSIETAQVMEELVDMAKQFRVAAARGETLGLTEDEVRFYDALAANESAVRALRDETLKKIAHELTENLRQNLGVDWSQRESVRAKLRLMVKRILRKYKYPPDLQDSAVELVLQQMQVIGEDWAL